MRQMSNFTKPSAVDTSFVRDEAALFAEELRASRKRFLICFAACMVPAWVGTWTAFALVLLKL